MPDCLPDNDPLLLQRIAKGDTQAFSVLYHHYSSIVYHTVMLYVRNESETEEIVQQVFVKLWERRSTLTHVRSLRNYLFILVRNHVFSYFSRLTRQARLLEGMSSSTGVDGEQLFLQKQYDQLVEKAICRLPERQKQVWLLADQENLGYDDIAERMQISRMTAKKHMELARKSVREYISRYIRKDEPLLLPGLLVVLFSLFYW